MTVGRVADKADIVLPIATGQLAAVAIMLSSTRSPTRWSCSFRRSRPAGEEGWQPAGDGPGQHQRHLHQRAPAQPGLPRVRRPRQPTHLRSALLHACISNRRPSLAVSSCIDRSVSVSSAGDIHLAMFRVRKTVVVEAPSTSRSTEEAEGAQQETTAAEDI